MSGKGILSSEGQEHACQMPRFGAEHLGGLSLDQGPAPGRERDQSVPESPSRPQRTPAADFLLHGGALSPALPGPVVLQPN